jgi:hypothetical protein
VLATVNRRLIGRSGDHFATRFAAENHPDCTMRIANAGHLRLCLNGREMEHEGSLRLGMTKEPHRRWRRRSHEPSQGTPMIRPIGEVSRDRAASIVEQVLAFGQEDDITVVGVDCAA